MWGFRGSSMRPRFAGPVRTLHEQRTLANFDDCLSAFERLDDLRQFGFYPFAGEPRSSATD